MLMLCETSSCSVNFILYTIYILVMLEERPGSGEHKYSQKHLWLIVVQICQNVRQAFPQKENVSDIYILNSYQINLLEKVR